MCEGGGGWRGDVWHECVCVTCIHVHGLRLLSSRYGSSNTYFSGDQLHTQIHIYIYILYIIYTV